MGDEALTEAIEEGGPAIAIIERYLGFHIDRMVGEQGPIAILSEIPSLPAEHREDILARSRYHSERFEALIRRGIDEGDIVECDVRMAGNAILGALNWIPKWFHGDPAVAGNILDEFPRILSAGLAAR